MRGRKLCARNAAVPWGEIGSSAIKSSTQLEVKPA
jgi:hypothetical protein